jgi:Fe-S cluster assembly iron-binding protein IscA
MALDEPEENEKPVQINGLDVLIADFVRPFTDGNKLDYVKNPDGEGFVMESGSSCC